MAAKDACESMDRVSLTRRPTGRYVMHQRWADLLFLHWVVPADSLRSLLPPGLELDTYAGNAYIGLVPFTMTGVRPVGTPAIPLLSNFHETNVRTYVHRQGRDPGVWFFSLDAANALAVRIARAWYRLPYHFARMRLDRLRTQNPAGPGVTVDYETERLWPKPVPAWCSVCYSAGGPVTPAAVGTLEHFLAERYLLYAYSRGHLYSGRVYHTPYPLQQATVNSVEESMIAAAGIARPEVPPLTLYASEVTVQVYPLRRVKS